jgi:hypothetical protein
VVLGVVMLSVSCLAVFGATGAITAERGSRLAASIARIGEATKPEATKTEVPAKPEAPAKTDVPAKIAPSPTAEAKPEPSKPVPQGTIAPKPAAVGPEGSIAQRLDREAVGTGVKLRALGAAKTTQGDRAVLAIYVRMDNVGQAPVKVDPAFFKLIDRQGTRYPISKAIEASLPAIELAAGPAGGAGQNTEGNLTFEIPKAAAGLALVYEPADGAAMRIPLPPEFG